MYSSLLRLSARFASVLLITLVACPRETDTTEPELPTEEVETTCSGSECSPTTSDTTPVSAPVRVSGNLECATTRSPAGRSIAVSENGTLFVAMRCGATSRAHVASSADGVTFGPPVSVGLASVEELAVAAGPDGSVFLAATVNDPLPSVQFVRSTDGGASWSTPLDLGPYSASDDLFGHEVSIAVRGTDVFVQHEAHEDVLYGDSGSAVVRLPDLGAQPPVSFVLETGGSFEESFLEPVTDVMVLAGDALLDARHSLHVSVDGGETYTLTTHDEATPGLVGDWGAGGGRFFFAGTGFGVYGDGGEDSRLLTIYAPAEDPWHQTLVTGLPAVEYGTSLDDLFHRALAADAFGHVYVVSRLASGAIQLDRLVSGASTFEPAWTVAPAGAYPAIAALPTEDGAAIAYTTTSEDGLDEVYATVVRYPALEPCVPGGTGSCLDVDECVVDNGGCDPEALCTSELYGRSCTCRPGVFGDGLTCTPPWTEVARLDLPAADREGFGISAVAVGSQIFLRPQANDLSNLYFYAVDTADAVPALSPGLAIPEGAQTDFCACGYSEVFVSDGVDIFMFGNHGLRYDVSTNVWLDVPAYTNDIERGEAAAAYDDRSGTVRMMGGRGDLDTTLTFTVDTESFVVEDPRLPIGLSVARAWSPPGTGITYVAGGFAADGGRRTLLAGEVSADGTVQPWVRLADAPADVAPPLGMGDFGGVLWVANQHALLLFDPVAGAWRPDTIELPEQTLAVVTSSTGTYAMAQDGEELVLHRLVAIE